jgi:hypothetical protein
MPESLLRLQQYAMLILECMMIYPRVLLDYEEYNELISAGFRIRQVKDRRLNTPYCEQDIHTNWIYSFCIAAIEGTEA